MEALSYLLNVNLIFAFALMPYVLLLRQETFFRLNRSWLLGSAGSALLWPLFPAFDVPLIGEVIEVPRIFSTPATQPATGSWSWWSFVVPVYFSVALIFVIRLLLEIRRTLRAAHGPRVTGAWCFFRTIVLPNGLDEAERVAILRHELVHVEHWHSADVIFFRVMQAISWPIPTWTWALRELRSVHEYTADDIASRACSNYAMIMVSQALGVPVARLAHPFHSSNLKMRSHMLTRKPSSRSALAKYVVAAPFVLLLSFTTSRGHSATPLRMQERASAHEPEKQPEFHGGMEGLMTYLSANLKYPKAAEARREEGTVYMRYVVRADGSIGDVTVSRGVSAELDAEALRVVKAMPNWTPGSKDGKPVAVELTLPVRFQLGPKK